MLSLIVPMCDIDKLLAIKVIKAEFIVSQHCCGGYKCEFMC